MFLGEYTRLQTEDSLLKDFIGRIALGIWGGANILAAHEFVFPPQLKAISDVPGCPVGPPSGVSAIEVSW
jgi:hypothetical protein